MASEEANEPVTVAVPEELAGWLRRRSDERGVDAESYARELLAAQRAVDEGAVAEDLEDAGDLATADDLDDRLDDVRAEFRELLEDVRGRVVQVKRETDGKAPADHDHEALEDVDGLREEVATLSEDLDEHQDALEDLREDVDGGFENFEEVLEYLLETTDDLVERSDRLAAAVLSTRERLQSLETAVQRRERTDELVRDAALEGIASADCEDCGRTVRAAMLTEPRCPACAATFVDVQPKRGLLGSATFVTGDLPALAGGDADDVAEELEADLEESRPAAADVDWESTGDRG